MLHLSEREPKEWNRMYSFLHVSPYSSTRSTSKLDIYYAIYLNINTNFASLNYALILTNFANL